MKIFNGLQGSPEWSAFRATRFTASEAAAIFGAHKYMTRDQLLHQKATGEIPEVSPAQQALFDRGHATEAAARPIAERIIGDDLYPVTGEEDEGLLAASMDGLTMLGDAGWEHKLWSQKLAAHIRDVDSGACELDDHYRWQLDQQMAVSGAENILFMCSDGTEDNCIYVTYERDESRIDALRAGWQQFAKDLAEYAPKAQKVSVAAAVQDSLPTPWADVKGDIAITDNLRQFGQALTAYVANINLKPETDQDFADLDAACKNLKDAENQLTQCEEMALAKLDSVKVLRDLINDYRETARHARLVGEKAVKAEKENRKNAIVQQAQEAFRKELAAANEEFAPVAVTGISADFYGATKGLKTLSSMESKCNDELARAKIELTAKRDQIRGALKIIDSAGADYKLLFSDIQQLANTAHDHLKLLVEKRVADHKAAEGARIEREAQAKAERMREEERQREAAEAKRHAEPTTKDSLVVAETPKPAEIRPAPKLASSQPAKAGRPTDNEIIETLALHYRVHESKVIEWLCAMDLSEAGAHMVANI
jgi:predicted phage-related endonuclease